MKLERALPSVLVGVCDYPLTTPLPHKNAETWHKYIFLTDREHRGAVTMLETGVSLVMSSFSSGSSFVLTSIAGRASGMWSYLITIRKNPSTIYIASYKQWNETWKRNFFQRDATDIIKRSMNRTGFDSGSWPLTGRWPDRSLFLYAFFMFCKKPRNQLNPGEKYDKIYTGLL